MGRLVELGRRRPALVGVQGLLLIALLLGLALNASRLPFFTGPSYRAEFSDASGLQVGEEVRMAGVKVGQVRGIDLRDDVVVVTFDVDGPRLGDRTSASIEVKTLLGQHYLAIHPEGGRAMRAGSTIPLSRTTTPLNVVPAFQRLTTTAGRIDSAQLSDAFDALADVLGSSAPEVRGTLRGLSRLSQSISNRDQQVQQLFESAEQVTGTLADRDQDITRLLRASREVLGVLDARRTIITAIIRETSALAGQVRGLVADNRAALGPALAKVNRVLDVLRSNRDNIEQALRNTAAYGREFSSVGGTGRFFDGGITVPRGFALCTVEPSNALSQLLDPILSQLNQGITGSSQACIPFGNTLGHDDSDDNDDDSDDDGGGD